MPMGRSDAIHDGPVRVRVKICGITSVEDARGALDAGADLLGVNMVAGPRQVTADLAGEIIEAVTANADPSGASRWPVVLARVTDGRLDEAVERVLIETGARWLQLYGDVTADAIRAMRRAGRQPVVVVRVTDADFAASFSGLLAECGDDQPAAVVLDAYRRGQLGGTGETFCWSWVVEARRAGLLDGWPPIILAGGLTPENVARAVRTVRPWAVDVSSGVEADPGRKDPRKLADFVRNARETPA